MIVPCFQEHSELGERVGMNRFEPNGSPHRLFGRFQFVVQVSYAAEKKPEVCIPGEYFQRGREFLRRLGKALGQLKRKAAELPGIDVVFPVEFDCTSRLHSGFCEFSLVEEGPRLAEVFVGFSRPRAL
jgi:hypothetical protein